MTGVPPNGAPARLAPIISGVQLREITPGSLLIAGLLKVDFHNKVESLSAMGEEEAQRQIFTFLFIHGYTSNPEAAPDAPENLNALRDVALLPSDRFLTEYLIPFAMQLRMAGLIADVVEWIAESNRATLRGISELMERLATQGQPSAA